MAYVQSMYIIYGDRIYEFKVHGWAVKQKYDLGERDTYTISGNNRPSSGGISQLEILTY